jgi:hypothetical protein
MPDFVEPLVTELVITLVSAPESERPQLLSAITPELFGTLGWYARMLAGRSVRDRSREDLWNGLVAIAIGVVKGDFRDAMSTLSLLYNSALRLKEDPRVLFEAASKLTTPSVAKQLEDFLDRPPELKSPGVFGFSEGVGPHGFDYVPLLPEYGGPTPF